MLVYILLGGVGKTYILSWLIVKAILSGEKSLAFSQSYKSLTQNLFEEVLHRFEELGIEPDYNKGSVCISYRKGKVYGFTYTTPDACRGQTNCQNLFLDELALAPQDLFGITAPCLRGEGIVPKIRFCSSPRMGCYWNKQVQDHLRTSDWDIFTSKMRDNKFLSEESLALAEQAITDPLMKKQELEGEILDDVIENCIIDLKDINTECLGKGGNVICGIDFSRFGVDSTCICVRDDYQILEIKQLYKADTAQITSEFRKLDNKYHFKDVYLDSTGGFSVGFYDSMKLIYNNLHEINFGGKPLNPQDMNIRASMYFNLSDSIKNGFYINEELYPDLLEEIKTTSYIINSNGKRALIPKSDIKEILGRSPDMADSLALTFACYKSGYNVDRNRCAELTRLLFK